MKKYLFIFLYALSFIPFGALSQEIPLPKILNPNNDIPKDISRSTAEFRERLLEDPYRPAYHFCIPEGKGYPFDPNAAFYYKGRYHLMYLFDRAGQGFSFGHVSSNDMLHWRYHPNSLFPSDGDDGIFSGGAFVDDDNSVILSYWIWGNGNKGIGLAKNTDDSFNNWQKFKTNPVIESTDYGITDLKDKSGLPIHVGSADPSNIWKKGGEYFMLTGNLLVLRKYGSRGKGLPANREQPPLPNDSINYQGDKLYLFTSKDLNRWTYMHEFYKSDRKWTGKTEDNMCPSFLPLPSGPDGGNQSGKHLLLFISHNKGTQYYIGDYHNDHFTPETHGRMTWNDNAYFAPEALIDNNGRQIMWSWIFDDRPDSLKNYYGWTGTYGLPRSLWLNEDGTLGMQAIKELEALRMNEKTLSNIHVNSGDNIKLNELGHGLMELEVTFSPSKSNQYGIKVCASDDGQEETLIYYDRKEKSLKIDTRKSGLSFGRKMIEEAPLELKRGEALHLRIFVDKSIVEVFANNRQAIARRIYPTLGDSGISAFSNNGDVKIESIKSWEIMPSNPY